MTPKKYKKVHCLKKNKKNTKNREIEKISTLFPKNYEVATLCNVANCTRAVLYFKKDHINFEDNPPWEMSIKVVIFPL